MAIVKSLRQLLQGGYQEQVEQLEQLQENPLFPRELVEICLSNEPVQDRQFAAITLKNFVSNRWSFRSEGFCGLSCPSDAVKVFVRSYILHGLSDPNPGIRSTLAAVVSKIAHLDWPDEWPDLFDSLVGLLSSGNLDAMHGSLQVLQEFINDNITEDSLPDVVPSLLPVLYEIYTSGPVHLRVHAVSIVHGFIDMIYMINSSNQINTDLYLSHILSTWMPAFLECLKLPCNGNLEIKTEVLRSVVKMIRFFPKQMAQTCHLYFESTWNDLVSLQGEYENSYLKLSIKEFEEQLDHDSCSPLEQYLFTVLDLVQIVSRKKMFAKLFKGHQGATDFLTQLVQVLLVYMQITTATQVAWQNDLTQFVQDNEDEGLSFNIRVAVDECFGSLFDVYTNEACQALCVIAMSWFHQGVQEQSQGIDAWWKRHEVALYALGRNEDRIKEFIARNRQAFDVDALFVNIVSHDMKASLPLLQGRALWFGTQFSSVLQEGHVGECVMFAMQQLSAADEMMCVFGLKSIKTFLSLQPLEKFGGIAGPLLDSLARLAQHATEEKLLLVLETLTLAVKISEQSTADHESMLSSLIVYIWPLALESEFTNELLQDLFGVLTRNKPMSVAFQTRMFPFLVESLRDDKSALDLLTLLMKHVADPFPTVYTTQVFPLVIALMLKTDKEAMLQNGTETVKMLVHRDFQGIANWTDGQTRGIDLIMQFVGKLLGNSCPESASIFVGDLIIKCFEKGGQEFVPALPMILEAVITRLEQAIMPSLVQSLVTVFCHLIPTYATTVVDFLDRTSVNGKNGLHVLMHTWCNHFGDFHGVSVVRASIVALCTLYDLNHASLERMTFQGDLIARKSQRIVTRSVSRVEPEQYTQVGFKEKVAKLLLEEYKQQQESKMKNVDEMDGVVDKSDDDDEWEEAYEYGDFLEEEEEEEEEGNGVDVKEYLEEFMKRRGMISL